MNRFISFMLAAISGTLVAITLHNFPHSYIIGAAVGVICTLFFFFGMALTMKEGINNHDDHDRPDSGNRRYYW